MRSAFHGQSHPPFSFLGGWFRRPQSPRYNNFIKLKDRLNCWLKFPTRWVSNQSGQNCISCQTRFQRRKAKRHGKSLAGFPMPVEKELSELSPPNQRSQIIFDLLT